MKITDETVPVSRGQQSSVAVDKEDHVILGSSCCFFNRAIKVPATVQKIKALAPFRDGTPEIRAPGAEKVNKGEK